MHSAPNKFDVAQAKLDAISARYEVVKKPLDAMFLAGTVLYDEYIARSARLRERMSRELDRVVASVR